MKSSRRGAALRKLLESCDDLQRMRTRLVEHGLTRDLRTRLERRIRTKTDRLARDLSSYRFRGPLGRLLREYRLESVHFEILATLLQRHLRSESPAIEGRLLLASVFHSAFDVLTGSAVLHETGVLRMSGLVVLDDAEQQADDVLEARFRLSDDALQAFRGEVAGLVVDAPRGAVTAYPSNHAVLLDLRFVHNLYKHRSDRVFHQERWDRVDAGAANAASHVSRRIESAWRRFERRVDATTHAERLPAIRFFREHDLGRAETIIVVHLLFRELYEGNAYADAAELVRLVSADELELVRNRRLVLDSGRLRRAEILDVEPMLEGRTLTGEAHLADWVVNYLFGAAPDDDQIDSDDRLDWHLYLKSLEDTGSFFRDRGAN